MNYGTFTKTFRYTYFANGQKQSFTMPNGPTYSYAYDAVITEVHLDEMWSFVKRKVSRQAEDGLESPQEADDGRQGVAQLCPACRLILATVVGPRTPETALKRIQLTAVIVLGMPAFLSDGFSSSSRPGLWASDQEKAGGDAWSRW